MPTTPAAPATLRPASKVLWKSYVDERDYDPVQLEVLKQGLQARDRADQAKEILDREGLTVATKTGVKTHPCVLIERDSRMHFVKIMHTLGLSIEEPSPGPGRPTAYDQWNGANRRAT